MKIFGNLEKTRELIAFLGAQFIGWLIGVRLSKTIYPTIAYSIGKDHLELTPIIFSPITLVVCLIMWVVFLNGRNSFRDGASQNGGHSVEYSAASTANSVGGAENEKNKDQESPNRGLPIFSIVFGIIGLLVEENRVYFLVICAISLLCGLKSKNQSKLFNDREMASRANIGIILAVVNLLLFVSLLITNNIFLR